MIILTETAGVSERIKKRLYSLRSKIPSMLCGWELQFLDGFLPFHAANSKLFPFPADPFQLNFNCLSTYSKFRGNISLPIFLIKNNSAFSLFTEAFFLMLLACILFLTFKMQTVIWEKPDFQANLGSYERGWDGR